MKTYTYSEARQNLSDLLDEATRSGEVQIRRRDGRSFAVRPAKTKRSPLDVEHIDADLSAREIVNTIRQMRRRQR